MAHRKSRSRFDTGVSLRTGLVSTGLQRQTKVLSSMVQQRIAAGPRAQPIRAATMSGGKGIALRFGTKIAKRVFGSRTTQVQAIARQTAARPAVRVGALGGGVVAAERIIEATTGRSPARMVFDLARQAGLDRVARGRSRFDTGPKTSRRETVAQSTQLAVQHVAVRQWQTFAGGPVFTRFADGHIEVQKKDGTVKHFRPYRPVVIPRKWNARSMQRVATALKRQRKTATKILQITGGVPKRTVRVSSREHRSIDT